MGVAMIYLHVLISGLNTGSMLIWQYSEAGRRARQGPALHITYTGINAVGGKQNGKYECAE